MYFDIIQTKKNPHIEDFAKQFKTHLFTLEELKAIKFVQGKNDLTIRKTLEYKQADILLNPHQGRERDFLHSKNSGLNHILCTLARKNNIALAITLDQCYEVKDLAKIMQNISLCRKYNVPLYFFTFATTPYELKNPLDLISLGKTLGMSSKQAEEAVSGFERLLKTKNIKY